VVIVGLSFGRAAAWAQLITSMRMRYLRPSVVVVPQNDAGGVDGVETTSWFTPASPCNSPAPWRVEGTKVTELAPIEFFFILITDCMGQAPFGCGVRMHGPTSRGCSDAERLPPISGWGRPLSRSTDAKSSRFSGGDGCRPLPGWPIIT